MIPEETAASEVNPEANLEAALSDLKSCKSVGKCVWWVGSVVGDSSVLPVTHSRQQLPAPHLNLKNDEHTNSPGLSKHIIRCLLLFLARNNGSSKNRVTGPDSGI